MLGVVSAIGGLGSLVYGGIKSAMDQKAAKAKFGEIIGKQKAANEAWYDRNYYQDYMNTVQAQNALKRVRNAWEDEVQKARARAAITGGTPEQAQAVAEAGGKVMADTIGNLAAQGEQNKLAIDSQKLAMDNNLASQELNYANQLNAANQQAAGSLMKAGMGLIGSGLEASDVTWDDVKGIFTPKKKEGGSDGTV